MSGMTIPEYGWSNVAAEKAHDYVWPAVQRLLPEGRNLRVLDLGCGNGWIAGKLADLGHDVTGVDASEAGIELARQQYSAVKFACASVYDDLDALGVGCFDVVVSSEVIEHLYFPRILLARASKALKTGGVLIISTPFHGWLKNLALSLSNKWDRHLTVLWDGGHIKFFSEATMTALLTEQGFGDIRFANAGRLPLLWKSMVVRALKPTAGGSNAS